MNCILRSCKGHVKSNQNREAHDTSHQFHSNIILQDLCKDDRPSVDQPPVLAVLGSVLVPLLRAFSGTGLRTRFVPSDPFRISGCRIGPVPICPLFSHFQSPSSTTPVGTTYTTTKPPDIDTLAHPKLPSTRSPLQT